MATQQLLLVERDAKSLQTLKVSLEQAGYAVATARDGAEALEQIDRLSPALLIIAVELPRMDGYGLVRRLKEHSQWARIPIILLTAGECSMEDRIRGLELGIEEFLSKPVFVHELCSRVQLMLAKGLREQIMTGAAGTNVEGNLADVSVLDVINAMHQGRQSGVGLLVLDPGRQGSIFFNQGSITDASYKNLRGEEAVFRLLTWSTGHFKVLLDGGGHEQVIGLDTPELLEAGVQSTAEFSRLLEQLPALDTVMVVDGAELLARMSEIPDELDGIIRLFDGRRTLHDMLDDSPFDDLSTLLTIAKLHSEELLSVAPAKGSAARAAPLGEGGADSRTGAAVPREGSPAAAGAAGPARVSYPVGTESDLPPLSEEIPAGAESFPVGLESKILPISDEPTAEGLGEPSAPGGASPASLPDGAAPERAEPARPAPERAEPARPAPERAEPARPAPEPARPAPEPARPAPERAEPARPAAGDEAGEEPPSEPGGEPEQAAAAAAEGEPAPGPSAGRAEADRDEARESEQAPSGAEPPPAEPPAPASGDKPVEAAPEESESAQPAAPEVGAKPAEQPTAEPSVEDEQQSEEQPQDDAEQPAADTGSEEPPPFSEDEPPYLTEEQLRRKRTAMKYVGVVVGVLLAILVYVLFLRGGRDGAPPAPPISPTASSTATSAFSPLNVPTMSSASITPTASASASASASAAAEDDLPDNLPEDLIGEIHKLLNLGKMEDIVPLARAAIKKHPDNAVGYFALASAYQSLRFNPKSKYKGVDQKIEKDLYNECVTKAKPGPPMSAAYIGYCQQMGGRKKSD